MSDVIILVDGNALLHRAFHALPPLTTSKGELVNATYGFALMLFKALNELKPRYAAVAFDKAGPTFRHKEFEEYKAHRPQAPEGLFEQLERVKELVQILNIPIYEAEGYEADDVLGTLAKQAAEKGLTTVILSGDTDALQLVGPRIKIMVPGKTFSETTVYDEAAVREKYDLSPKQLIDFKGLKGDPSDNIPGVPGIGEKTAKRLLAQFGSIEAIYDRLEEVDEKTRRILQSHRDIALQSKRLATIVTDVPITLDLEKCRIGTYDRKRVLAFLRELEFRSLFGRIPEQMGADPRGDDLRQSRKALHVPEAAQMPLFEATGQPKLNEPATWQPLVTIVADQEKVSGDYKVISTEQELDELIARIRARGAVAVDVETTHKEAMRASIVGIAFCVEPGEACYVPVGHRQPLTGDESGPVVQLAFDLVREKVSRVLADRTIKKFGHNAKYDVIVLSRNGIELLGLEFDTMVAAYLIDPSRRIFNLKDLVSARLGIEMMPIEALIGKGKLQITMAEVPIARAADYACADADMAYRLAQVLRPELLDSGLWPLFTEVEMPLVSVLAKMEQHGVAIDVPFLQRLSGEIHHQVTEIEQRIYEQAGHRFNINSTQQLGAVLFQELRLPASRRTKTGYSTEAEVLEELRGVHPIIELILEYRQLTKLKSTYVDALPLMVNPITGRLHTSFNQTGTVTGRLSSSEPNLQNIPIRTELGRKIRQAFIAQGRDSLLLSADYSQVELRILAHISKDERLLAAFAADDDIHTATAAEIFGVCPDRVTPEQRRVAKVVNFGIIYGISDYGLSVGAGLDRRQAAEYIDNYLAKYEGVCRYIEDTKRKAYEQGYVTTLLGRRRYLPEINVNHRGLRLAAERTAINMPIQGTAADIIKIAMVRLDEAMTQRKLRSRMILQVHDELLFEVPRDEVEEMRELVADVMENALPLDVRLKVDLNVGSNWDMG